MAERVRELATASRFNASSLGEAVGVPKSSAAIYWAGKRAWPTEVVTSLADRLSTTVDFLLRGGESGAVGDRRLEWKGFDHESDPDLVELDEVDLRFGLGGSYLEGPVAARKRQFSREWLRTFTRAAPDMLFWAEGDGDSMEPTIRSGEPVLIDRSQDTLRSADGIWAVALGEIGMIKRLRPLRDGTVKILSDNDQVPEETAADGELHIIGRVVAVVRRL